jgi:site-specific DNA-methyltransferase (adenine-specific)
MNTEIENPMIKFGRALEYRLAIYMDASDKIEKCTQDLLDPGSPEDEKSFNDIMGITREEFVGLVEGGLFNRDTLDNKIAIFARREERCTQFDRSPRERLDFLIKYYSSIGSFSSEIMTPGIVIEKMIDMIPSDVLLNKNTTFLDPACGRGTFLAYLFVQLMDEFVDEIPNENERAQNIVQRLSGCDISKLQTRIAKSMLLKLTKPYGINRRELNVNCCDFLKSEFGMKFDVVIGNPPYQTPDQAEDSTNSNAMSASTLYHKFHFKALRKCDDGNGLEADHVIFIVPSKCLAGGKGLDDFRNDLRSGHVKQIIFKEDSTYDPKWFNGSGPTSGHIIYHYQKSYRGAISFINENTGLTHQIDSSKYDVILRDPRAESIIDKVLQYGKFIPHYGSKPFGMRTNHFKKSGRIEPSENEETLQCIWDSGKRDGSLAFRSVIMSEITKNRNLINRFKVITPEAGGGGSTSKFLGSEGTKNIFILKPNEICTETYLVLNVFDDLEEAINFKNFMHSAFAQYVVCVKKPTQHIVGALDWVPELDWTKKWNDKSIYEFFKLTDDEIKLIETEMVKVVERHRKYQLKKDDSNV